MHITLLGLGSRGDTQPYIALGRHLQQHGHTVTLCAGDDFETLVNGYGLAHASAGISFDYFVEHHMQTALASGRNTLRALHNIYREGLAHIEVMRDAVDRACAGTDAIIANMVGMVFAYEMAHARDLPLFLSVQQPALTRTRTLPSALLPISERWGGTANLLTHMVLEPFFKRFLNLPLRDLHRRRIPVLYGFSPAVVPKPADWPDHVHITGYWFLEHAPGWQPPADLVAFLQAGPPPVYAGFGSMSSRKPEETRQIVIEAARRAGQRLVLATGTGHTAPDVFGPGVYALAGAPHDWLFPQMAALVHHGGAGTTGAGLRSGVPAVIVPFFGDQPFWGDRIRALGVGPAPIPRRGLTADRLAYALRIATTHGPMRARAAELGARIRAEDGAARAVAIVDRVLDSRI
ncbi:MAG: glycosyltransferase family 1 protein [Anaerolineae bacterium]|nr:glycosyltransferase family 1 protein [Anaerolineae bacterium]